MAGSRAKYSVHKNYTPSYRQHWPHTVRERCGRRQCIVCPVHQLLQLRVNVSNRSGGMFCRTSAIIVVRQNWPNGSQVVHITWLFGRVSVATCVAKSTFMPNRLVVMQQTCLSIESTGYVVTVNEILVCEYVTECNVAPSGVRKLNKRAVDFGHVA